MQTAKKLQLVRDTRPKDLEHHLQGIAQDVSVIYWACVGMRETDANDGLAGIERLTQRIQDDLEAIAEELRS